MVDKEVEVILAWSEGHMILVSRLKLLKQFATSVSAR